jgi:hypothetical protein
VTQNQRHMTLQVCMIVTRKKPTIYYLHRYLPSGAFILNRTMSFQAALSKLPSPLKDLVIGTNQDSGHHFGKSEKDQAEVVQWVEKAASGDILKPSGLKVRSFFVLRERRKIDWKFVGFGFSPCSPYLPCQ